MSQGRRYGMGGVLIVLDLNGFRSVNEEHGQRAGDRVLIAVARALANRLRETDLLARIGGDQFAVLLPRAKPPEGERVCQALEDAIPEEVHRPATAGSRRASASCPSPHDELRGGGDAGGAHRDVRGQGRAAAPLPPPPPL